MAYAVLLEEKPLWNDSGKCFACEFHLLQLQLSAFDWAAAKILTKFKNRKKINSIYDVQSLGRTELRQKNPNFAKSTAHMAESVKGALEIAASDDLYFPSKMQMSMNFNVIKNSIYK